MNTKNNRRRQASVERIRQALMEFLKKKELPQITVAEICKKAAINRSTFYAHYADIYDLADHIYKELENEVTQLLTPQSGWQQSAQGFLKLLYHIRDNQDLYYFYFKLGYENRNLIWYDSLDLQTLPDASAVDYHVAFFRSGFNAIIKLWLRSGCRETPEQMCQILLNEYRGRLEPIFS